MDSSHVALVALHLSADGFESFRCDQSMVLGINIGNLAKVLKLGDNNESIALQATPEGTHLKVIFENSKSGKTTQFNLNLITTDSERLAIPETEYSSVVSIYSAEFNKICRELYQLSETVMISTTPDYVQFSVEGEVGSGLVRLGPNDSEKKEDQTMLEVNENVNLQFALRYLNMFNKASSLSSFTRLCMRPDQPLVVQFKIENNMGDLKYFLAPKISDE